MSKQVRITIKGGRVQADYIGFAGQECKTLQERIRVEGLDEQEVEDKPELLHLTQTDSNTQSY